jgi:hypothetical protein
LFFVFFANITEWGEKFIRADLERTLDKTKLSTADVAHDANEKAGMDKFKTMKKAQSGAVACLFVFCHTNRRVIFSLAAGDAKNRVSDFENLEDTDC